MLLLLLLLLLRPLCWLFVSCLLGIDRAEAVLTVLTLLQKTFRWRSWASMQLLDRSAAQHMQWHA